MILLLVFVVTNLFWWSELSSINTRSKLYPERNSADFYTYGFLTP